MSTERGSTAWFHCFAGTAGDMTMASLVHAGADPVAVAAILAGLPVHDYALSFAPAMRCGLSRPASMARMAAEMSFSGSTQGQRRPCQVCA